MPHAVKLSNGLIEDARAAAELEHRSVASQIEHWARLGRALEQDLHPPALQGLIARSAADGGPSDGSLATRLGAAIDAALEPAARAALADDLGQRYRYGTDKAFPGYLVRDDPDGGRVPGRFIDRSFVPLVAEDDDDPPR
jgi:hypothetical protein